jgi:hypothetical protein
MDGRFVIFAIKDDGKNYSKKKTPSAFDIQRTQRLLLGWESSR